MIRSALQAILSKLLYKYVENLHVDDLLYPSVLGFVAGAVSGAVNKSSTSIHVKNVKLRNGTNIYSTNTFLLKLGEGGLIGSLKVGMEGADYSIIVEDAVICLELIMLNEEVTSNEDKSSSDSLKREITDLKRNSSRLLTHDNSSSADKTSIPTDDNTTSEKTFLEAIDSFSRALAVLPRVQIINCQVHLKIILTKQESSTMLEEPYIKGEQFASVKIGIGSFTITEPELFETTEETTMVQRYFKLTEGGFWISATGRNSSNRATAAASAKIQPFYHRRTESNSSYANFSAVTANTSNFIWACERWATASTSNLYGGESSLFLFKCPSFQMTSSWDYDTFRIITDTIEENRYEYSMDYPMLFDYQGVQSSGSSNNINHNTLAQNYYEDQRQNSQNMQQTVGVLLKISISKTLELNFDTDTLDTIGLIMSIVSQQEQPKATKKVHSKTIVPPKSNKKGTTPQQRSSQQFMLQNGDDLEQAPIKNPPHCTFELNVFKICCRFQQYRDNGRLFSSRYSFGFWELIIHTVTWKVDVHLQDTRATLTTIQKSSNTIKNNEALECNIEGSIRKLLLQKFVGAKKKEILLSVEGISSANTVSAPPRRTISGDSSNTRQANMSPAINICFLFAMPIDSQSSFCSTTTNSHLTLQVYNVIASLSTASVHELSETLGDAERRLFCFNDNKESKSPNTNISNSNIVSVSNKQEIIINYDMKVENVCVIWNRKIEMKLEGATVRGKKLYPDNEYLEFVKSLLGNVTFEIRCSNSSNSTSSFGCLSDDVRMRILLFVGDDDTCALEKVLKVASDSNRLMLMINLNRRLALI